MILADTTAHKRLTVEIRRKRAYGILLAEEDAVELEAYNVRERPDMDLHARGTVEN